MPAAVLAYVNGLHVIVVDGSDVFSGMTPLKATVQPDGSRTIPLHGGLQASLIPAGPDRMDLRFSSGESIAMTKAQTPK
jgi:hypothetical protein